MTCTVYVNLYSFGMSSNTVQAAAMRQWPWTCLLMWQHVHYVVSSANLLTVMLHIHCCHDMFCLGQLVLVHNNC